MTTTVAASLDLSSALVFFAIAVAAAVVAFRYRWTAPAMVVATAPFAWYHQLGPTEITVSKAAFVGAAIGIASALARDPALRANALSVLRSNRALLPLAALALWSAMSVAWAGTPAEALREALKDAWYAGAFALTLVAIEQPADGRLVLTAMFVAAAAVGVDGVWQHLTSAPAGFVAPNGEIVGRIAGTLEGPNQFGAYLESVIPPLLAILLLGRLSWPVVVCGGLALGLLVADLLLTFSRGALWATLAAVAIVTAAYVRLKLRGEAQAAPVAVPAALAACVALVVAPVALAAIGSTGWAHEFWTPTSRDASDSAVRRAQLWTCAMQVFERHPIVGVGAANFADAKQECPASLAGSEHFNANEWYLETAADLGVVGLALLVAFLCIVLAKGRSRAVWHTPVALGAYAVLIAFIMHGFIDDVADYPKAALSFFVLMGLLESRITPPM